MSPRGMLKQNVWWCRADEGGRGNVQKFQMIAVSAGTDLACPMSLIRAEVRSVGGG